MMEHGSIKQGIERKPLFSLLMPSLALLVSTSFFGFPAFKAYLVLKSAPHVSSMIMLSPDIGIPSDHLLSTILTMTAFHVEGPITLINAPGFIPGRFLSNVWFPNLLGPALWRILLVSLFASPAWWFFGRGLDGFFRGKRLVIADGLVALVLVLFSATVSLGLRFGLSESERAEQDMLPWYIAGFGAWAILFTVPFAAHLYRKLQNRESA